MATGQGRVACPGNETKPGSGRARRTRFAGFLKGVFAGQDGRIRTLGGLLAAVAFAATLLAVVKSGAVHAALSAIITAALNVIR